MAEFIVSRHRSRYAIGASNVETVDPMPVLPLSCIFISIEVQNNGGLVSDTPLVILQALQSVQFRYRGTQIVSLRGDDLYRLYRSLGLWNSNLHATSMADDARRLFTVAIPFGRKLWHPQECFPAVAKGETELYISWTAAPTGYDTFKYTLETLQLPEAKPTGFLRATTISSTPAATGDTDYDLPRAAPLLGIGLAQTASEPGSTLATIESTKVLANNQDYGYSSVSSQLGRELSTQHYPVGEDMSTHLHLENAAAMYTQNVASASQYNLTNPPQLWQYLDCDPLSDSQYQIDGRVFQDLKLRINFNTAAAIRIIPVEWWTPQMIIRQPGK